jgi:para-nitrobenzyl esterase
VQSGRLLTLRTPVLGSALTDKIYTKLGIKHGDIAALQRVPASLLANLYIPAAGEVTNVAPHAAYGPTVDGVVFKEQPWHGNSPASSRGIPMIIGTNLDETIGWIGEDIHKPYPTDDAIAAAAIKAARFVDIPLGIMAEFVPTVAMAALVAASHKELPEFSPAERLVRVSTDACFRAAAIHQSELRVQSGGAPVYSYECRWRTPCYGGKWAPHGIDVPAVFGHTHYSVAWDGKDSDAQRTAADKAGLFVQVQRRMLEAWAAFARTGNPSTPTLQWPAYDLNSRTTMAFDGESKVEKNPRPLLTLAAAQIFSGVSPPGPLRPMARDASTQPPL